VRSVRVVLLAGFAGFVGSARETHANLAVADYRYFRALSIDLAGRPPTRDELAAFEQPDFDLDAWIESHLTGDPYAERLRRIYMDALRLEIGPSFQYVPNPVMLRRQQITGPDGAPMFVYFRRGQRRVDASRDGDFCLTRDETGMQFPPNAPAIGTAKPVAQVVLDEHTVVVKPWWLYADYRSTTPSDVIAPEWVKRFPGFVPAPALLLDAGGKTKATSVRVCREEAQTAETGAVYASGRAAAKKGDPLPGGRLTQPPGDSGFARIAKGRAVSCLSGTGFSSSVECGCGIGLERCLPNAGPQNEAAAFVMPARTPLGSELPFEANPAAPAAWIRMWWGQEASRFLDTLFGEDRDFREVLTSRATRINGPLAQFYRYLAGASCCGPGADVGYSQPDPLFDPAVVPEALTPEDTATWLPVADRGPHASGILTMPVFLTKYGSRRARAHVLFNAFLCKDFVADSVKLAPSTDPDLTKRPGCSSCHQTLEPLAAYFTRVQESDWTWLPASVFPMTNARCSGGKGGGLCKQIYDPAFDKLRGAYGSPAHAELGPAGLAHELVSAPEFAPCVVENVAQSLLGRTLAPEDDAWKLQLVKVFVDGGYRMKALVRAIVKSPRYRAGNDRR
jgi:hypothetical protein